MLFASGFAQAETRTLKLYFIHTKERAEITYKKNGKYIPSGLNEINRFLRDWRRNEPAKMDPRLLDLVWSVYQSVGARDYIHVVSAYRSPATNSMLRSRSKGVAEKSQHMLGKAMDFYIPGVPLSKLRAAGFKAEVGGVGYYPSSGSPFVHLDVGNVRSWPRMKRNELMALFPDGKTIHLPADGKPLAGYKAAMAAYKARRSSGASAIQLASASESAGPRRGFLATLFGGGADEEEDASEAQVAAAPARRTATGQATASQPASTPAAVPAPAIEPQPDTPETILAALPARAVPVPLAAPRPSVDVGVPAPVVAAASAAAPIEMESEAETEIALNIPIPVRRPDFVPAATPAAAAPAVADQPVQVAATESADVAAQLAGLAANDGNLVSGKVAAEPSATLAAYVPIPSNRPAGDAEVMVAALPQNGALPGANSNISPKEARIARAQANGIVDERLARLASAPSASPRLALIARESGMAPESVVASGPKTTAKSAKPGPSDGGPDPRSVPMPVPRQVARWALSNEPVLLDTRGTKAPSFAHAAVRAAPQTVYTAGFQAPQAGEQPNRFTGKAVNFLSVARFSTN